uniref:Band 7 domain-containing protein n=1 Tax=Strombidium rassoulzadegani TaxID=1082188 RepID=A0A7S3CTC4_9SPIT|mmetsp:Transcript_8230/g.13778  ORF Transcript_8230/g.13778 Transcript_8230/m.13778 type:complete len:327 (+) Transcript_8230:311-1291(+)
MIYKFPVRAAPTYDNIFVALDIAVVFRCKPDDQSIFNFCYRISINQLNEQLEAAITERVRVLIRGKTHLEVYQIKGKQNTKEMKDFLNDMFGQKGLEFLDIIVTEVLLPEDIKQPLDMKAQFGSLNEMEREKYNFDMRVINDEEELELLKQRRYEQRDSINEDFSKQVTLTNRELQIVKANAVKSVAEINAQSKAEQAQIRADADLKNETIKGDTFMTKTVDETKGTCEAEMIKVDAKNQCSKSIAAKMQEVADLKASTIEIIGKGESQISEVMQSRRKYEYLEKKTEVIQAFRENKNLKIFGDNSDDVLSQVAAFRVTQGKGGIA